MIRRSREIDSSREKVDEVFIRRNAARAIAHRTLFETTLLLLCSCKSEGERRPFLQEFYKIGDLYLSADPGEIAGSSDADDRESAAALMREAHDEFVAIIDSVVARLPPENGH